MEPKATIGLEKTLKFDNRFVTQLPADPETSIRPRQVLRSCYSLVNPSTVAQPQMVAYAKEVAAQIGLDEPQCQTQEFANIFAGNTQLPEMRPYAMCYGGHQFGHWAGQLGDGRAINLGEVLNAQGEHLTLQLKGAGLTPYSRTADGLAVLRSSVREFLCSEAMHHLGVPTTRALSLVLTGEQVLRDMFYDGNAKLEPGAVVCRVAPSFIRFGNFQIFASRGETDVLQQLVDFTIRNDFPALGEPDKAVYIKWFSEVCRLSAEMIIHWMRVGFVHGVMNTDNMSILGLTIDYGPYGWLEDYNPGWTPNTTDAQGRRYCFGNQPQIAHWNLFQLANAILPLINDPEPLEQALQDFADHYQQGWQHMMAAKLGLESYNPDTDTALVTDLLELLTLTETDMTLFFRCLAGVEKTQHHSQQHDSLPDYKLFSQAYYQPQSLTEQYQLKLQQWLENYRARIASQTLNDGERRDKMNRVNPKYVLRNYLAQQAIDKAEEGDFSMVNQLLEVLRAPYEEQPQYQQFALKRPEWARVKPGCSMLSCSS